MVYMCIRIVLTCKFENGWVKWIILCAGTQKHTTVSESVGNHAIASESVGNHAIASECQEWHNSVRECRESRNSVRECQEWHNSVRECRESHNSVRIQHNSYETECDRPSWCRRGQGGVWVEWRGAGSSWWVGLRWERSRWGRGRLPGPPVWGSASDPCRPGELALVKRAGGIMNGGPLYST